MTVLMIARRAAASGLGAAAGLHVLWASGSSWPLRDRAELGRVVAGADVPSSPSSARGAPGPAACLAVASALASAAALVIGYPRRLVRLRRLGVGVASSVLLVRGVLGVSGTTPVPSRFTDFHRLDRRLYGPVCLVLGALSASALVEREE